MGAALIVAAIFAMLAIAVIGAVSLVNVIKKRGFPHLLMACGAGALFLGNIFFIMGVTATFVIGAILSILGWPTLGAAFVLLNLKVWQDEKKAAAPAPPKQA